MANIQVATNHVLRGLVLNMANAVAPEGVAKK